MSLEQHIAEARDAKATKVVRWLEQANTTRPVCRRCWLPLTRDRDDSWTDEDGGTSCRAPGFRTPGRVLHVPHVPERWTVARVENADPALRKRLGTLAGLSRPCSEETWARVVVLFRARVAALRTEG